jgi:hypothetical protein
MFEVIICKPKNGQIELNMNFPGKTIWLRQQQIADLFGTETIQIIIG